MDDEHTPQSYLSTNYIPLEIDIEKSSDPPPHSKTSTWRVKFYKYGPFAVHFAVTVLVATVCLGYLDGRTFNVNSRRPQYQEVDGSVEHATSYAPLQSDITTAVSVAATVTRVASGWWATGYIWRCIFVAMERGGISAKGVSQAISSWHPVLCHSTRKSNTAIIYITLFATFAIDYFSAALTGSFIWETADTQIPGKMLLSGIPDGSVYRVQVLTNTEHSEMFGLVNYESQIMTMASGSASIAWGTPQSNSISNITEPSTTFRRVIDGARYISTNSTLAQVPMPYFALDAFEWVRDPHQVLTNKQLSLLNQNASGYNPFIIRANGTGGLLPDGEWGEGPMTSSYGSMPGSTPMITSETRLFTFRIWFPWPMSTPPTTAPPCPQNFTIDPGSEVNFISGPDYPDGRDCFAIANMSYRAGITSSQNCKIISPSVVEAQGPSSLISNLYTPAALGMAPFIAATFFLSNYATPLNYGTNRNLGIELTSRAYQAAWAAIVDHVTMGTNATTVQIALPTLRAKVTNWRVYLWVALHLWVLALGLLFAYFQSYRDHPWAKDPAMAVFWLDTSAVLTDSEGRRASDPWQPGTEIWQDGMLILEHNEAGQRSVQVRRDGGSHGRRYVDSIPLRHRMPPSGSMLLRDKGRESVETLIGTSVPTSVQTSSLDSTRTPKASAE